jgi:hypothetical protein
LEDLKIDVRPSRKDDLNRAIDRGGRKLAQRKRFFIDADAGVARIRAAYTNGSGDRSVTPNDLERDLALSLRPELAPYYN